MASANPSQGPAEAGPHDRTSRRSLVAFSRVLPVLLLVGAAVPAASQQPTFRAQVNLVQVDVVATDASGRPVQDLRQHEFQIFEDGKPRDVVSFTLVNLPVPAPHPPAIRDVASSDTARDGRVYFLLLDDIHTLRSSTDQVRATARRLVERLGPHDQIAVQWLSLGKAGAREFTTNHAAVLAAIDQFAATKTRIARLHPKEIGLPDVDPEFRPSTDTAELAGRDLQAAFERVRPFVFVRDVCNQLARLEDRRKAIVYVGQGPTGQLLRPDASLNDEDVEIDVIRAITAARRANVAFYTINPGGPVADAASASSEPDSVPSLRDVAQARQDTFEAFGVATGGVPGRGARPGDAVDRIVADMSCYYLIGDYADPPGGSGLAGVLKGLSGDPWHGFRRIDVRSSRPGVRILARKGYWADDLGEPADAKDRGANAPPELRAVAGLLPRADLPLRAFATAFRGSAPGIHDVAIGVEVRFPESLQLPRTGDTTDSATLAIVAVEPGEKVRLTQRSETTMRLARDRSTGAVPAGYVLYSRLALAPGIYQVRIGVGSALAGRTGSVYADVVVPDFGAEPLSLSGIAIDRHVAPASIPVARANAIQSLGPFRPVLARTFSQADDVRAYVRAYVGAPYGASNVVLNAQICRPGESEAWWNSEETLTPDRFSTGREAEYSVRLPLELLLAGEYRLRVTAAWADRIPRVIRELDVVVREPDAPAQPATPSAPALKALSMASDSVLRRVVQYAERYINELPDFVAEEDYEQSVRPVPARLDYTTTRRSAVTHRHLRSDFLLVRVPGEPYPLPFRDVFEVDGRTVRDRDDRLQRLFIRMPPDAKNKARTIRNEGVRYNIGSVYRNVNQPVLPLLFMQPQTIRGFRYTEKGTETVDDITALRLDYVETGRPTIIRQEGTNRDMPSTGSIWVTPESGRVVRTLLRTGDGLFVMDTTVDYRLVDAMDTWMPTLMQELYTTPAELIFGKATYQNFRRFRVRTDETMAIPKK